MPFGWHSCCNVKLKRAKGFERNLSSLSLLSSSAQTFFFPETWETCKATERARDHKSLFTPASVGVLSEQRYL